ncbi:Flp family type IVb pilin [Nocardioides okcheonensis]|uniref:Flp family type IVb pilin n=1 Tax=Nocardioides okcheonensis TaxID=2894081 RepID=UPI001E5CF977|nr:Flp family type IVb pilin [Nocardioides okcheonensis]UFN45609.1 Flp family type IVb pilin [Nocardioides okcheonensis]
MSLHHLAAFLTATLTAALTPAERSDDERGATAVEYGLMVALIAVVIVGAVSLFGRSASSLFSVPASVFSR